MNLSRNYKHSKTYTSNMADTQCEEHKTSCSMPRKDEE